MRTKKKVSLKTKKTSKKKVTIAAIVKAKTSAKIMPPKLAKPESHTLWTHIIWDPDEATWYLYGNEGNRSEKKARALAKEWSSNDIYKIVQIPC